MTALAEAIAAIMAQPMPEGIDDLNICVHPAAGARGGSLFAYVTIDGRQHQFTADIMAGSIQVAIDDVVEQARATRARLTSADAEFGRLFEGIVT